MKKYLWIIISLLPVCLKAQTKEANIWYFGNHAGMDFSGGAPVAITDNTFSSIECSASICDENGNLLFYTDGVKIWNGNHQVMPAFSGGDILLAGSSSTDGALIVPQPCSNSIYYLFTAQRQSTLGYPGYGFMYNIIDMSRDGGSGDVAKLNQLLFESCTERVTAVRHANGRDIWIIAHEWNSNKFYAYLLTANGLDKNPVISAVGHDHQTVTFHGSKNTSNARGQMKASPDGSKIAVGISLDMVYELFKFDKATGKLSDPVTLDYSNKFTKDNFTAGAYSLEFSPDGRLLYINVIDSLSSAIPSPNNVINKLYQLPLSLGWNTKTIKNNAVFIDTLRYFTINGHQFQLGLDGKIYFGHPYSQYIHAIDFPNRIGTACGFTDSVLYLGGKRCTLGLPNFFSDYFYDPPFIFYNRCFGDTTRFIYQLTTKTDSIRWDFGDSKSGQQNFGKSDSDGHLFTSTGMYKVKMYIYQAGKIDSFERTVVIYPSAEENFLGTDTVLCEGETLNLSVETPCGTYQWQDGSTDGNYTVTKSGTYWVKVDGTCGIAADTIEVSYANAPMISLGPDTSICGEASINLVPSATDTPVTWMDGSTRESFHVTMSGLYWATVSNQCGADTDYVSVDFDISPDIDLGPDTSICKGQSILLEPGDAEQYHWQDGSREPTFLVNKKGLYVLEARNGSCIVRASIRISEINCNKKEMTNSSPEILLFIPNAFSPNDDGINDYFTFNTSDMKDLDIKIFNRWGEMVYHTTELSFNWDGKYKGTPVPQDVYIYLLQYMDMKLKPHFGYGNITLFR